MGRLYYPSHHSYVDLVESTTNGCHLCTILYVRTRHTYLRDIISFDNYGAKYGQLRSYAYLGWRDAQLYMFMRYPGQSSSCQFLANITFQPTQSILCSSDSLREGYEEQSKTMHVSREPQDTSRFLPAATCVLLQQWIHECNHKHQLCKVRIADAKVLPARLLDLQPYNRPLQIALCDTRALRSSETYMTLSHRWGSAGLLLRLLKENYTTLMQSIPSSTLPKTFLDAISVTRALKVRYLWIDALCIIQNSGEDWIRESAIMDQIYAGSHLNIAATDAEDASFGLFHERQNRATTPCMVDASWTSLPPGKYYTVFEDGYDHFVTNGPLNSRAWVFQERLLARRTLHFASDQLYWNCAQSLACETYSDLGIERSDWALKAFVREPGNRTTRVVGDDWGEIVEGYTTHDLTYESDKLIAISGIARTFQRNCGLAESTYLAGHWRDDLLRSLTWYLKIPEKRPSICIAPSWSWASVRGAVRFDRVSDSCTSVELISATSDLQTPGNVFGAVRGGQITLLGRLHRIHFGDLMHDSSGKPRFSSIRIGSITIRARDSYFSVRPDVAEIYTNWPSKYLDYYFVTISLGYWSCGILLERARGIESARGQYVRTGYVELRSEDEQTASENSLAANPFDECEYISRREDGRYEIQII